MTELFKAEPSYAADVLREVLADGDEQELMLTLSQIAPLLDELLLAYPDLKEPLRHVEEARRIANLHIRRRSS